MSETNPTAQETVEVALSGTGGVVKTLTDLRFEKLEARFAQLEKENAELRQANAELYAFAKAKETAAAPAPAASSAPAPAAPVAAVTVPRSSIAPPQPAVFMSVQSSVLFPSG